MIGDRYKDIYYSTNDTVYKSIPPSLSAGNAIAKTPAFFAYDFTSSKVLIQLERTILVFLLLASFT